MKNDKMVKSSTNYKVLRCRLFKTSSIQTQTVKTHIFMAVYDSRLIIPIFVLKFLKLLNAFHICFICSVNDHIRKIDALLMMQNIGLSEW